MWFWGGFLCAYILPSSFVHGNKSILNSLENFLCFDLERLNSVPKDLSGSWIKLCGKILYLLPCCHCSRCWISFYWLVNLSFCDCNVPKSPTFLLICRVLMSFCNQRDPDYLRLLEGLAISEPQSFSLRRSCPAPKSCLFQSRRSAVFLTHFFAFFILRICLYFLMTILPIEIMALGRAASKDRHVLFTAQGGRGGTRTLQVKFYMKSKK